jgi:hypothetical protein
MNINGNAYVQLIQAQKQEKLETLENVRKLKAGVESAQREAYAAVLKLNAEMANKCFKEPSHDIPFCERITSAVSLMVRTTAELWSIVSLSTAYDLH